MNYIRHLNAFFSFVRSDNRLTSSHVSLYLSLFQYWNFNRFQNPFPVYRENMMQLSKIGSKNTYHKCLKELHTNGYIMYHPAISKFQPIKISMLRLDIKEEENKFRQLDLFQNDSPENPVSGALLPLEKVPEGRMNLEEELGQTSCPNIGTNDLSELKNTSPKIGTDSVPILTGTSPKIGTGTVSKMGHNIKLNIKQINSVQNTPKKIFEKNEEIQKKINMPPFKENTQRRAVNEKAGVPNMGHTKSNITLSEVETFFKQNKYPVKEAQKFFYYNQGKNWMLTDKVAISDWNALAHKWMLNTKSENNKIEKEIDLKKDIQFVYELLLEGRPVSKAILAEHYEFLKLHLTDEVVAEAWQRRINQLTGGNENSENQLLEAYQTGDKNNNLVMQDEPNLIALSKRVAIFNYLKKLQQEGRLNVIDKD